MTNITKRLGAGAALAGAALLVSGLAQTAAAQPAYDAYGNPVVVTAPNYGYAASRPLTVQRRYAPVRVAPAYDPYSGPQAIITGPIAVASTLVALPFRVVNSVFPPYAHDPRVIVGGPVHVAGQVAQLPFRVLQAPFGGADYVPE